MGNSTEPGDNQDQLHELMPMQLPLQLSTQLPPTSVAPAAQSLPDQIQHGFSATDGSAFRLSGSSADPVSQVATSGSGGTGGAKLGTETDAIASTGPPTKHEASNIEEPASDRVQTEKISRQQFQTETRKEFTITDASVIVLMYCE